MRVCTLLVATLLGATSRVIKLFVDISMRYNEEPMYINEKKRKKNEFTRRVKREKGAKTLRAKEKIGNDASGKRTDRGTEIAGMECGRRDADEAWEVKYGCYRRPTAISIMAV